MDEATCDDETVDEDQTDEDPWSTAACWTFNVEVAVAEEAELDESTHDDEADNEADGEADDEGT